MKFLSITLFLFSTTFVSAQVWTFTVEGGTNLNFSSQIDIVRSPDFINPSFGYQYGGVLLYRPKKSLVSFGTGFYIDQQSTAANFNRLLYLIGVEDKKTLKRINYRSSKIPFLLSTQLTKPKTGKKVSLSGFTAFNLHYNWANKTSFYSDSEVFYNRNDLELTLQYALRRSTFTYQRYTLESGLRLFAPITGKIYFTTTVSYSMGFAPSLTTLVLFTIKSPLDPNGTYNIDSHFYNVSKGDALYLNIGITCKLGTK